LETMRAFVIRWWLVGILSVLAGGVILSLALFVSLRSFEEARIQADLSASAFERRSHISKALEDALLPITSAHRSFVAFPEMTREEFSLSVGAHGEEQPSVWSLAWAPYVTIERRTALVQQARVDGLRSFDFMDLDPGGVLRPAGRRSHYVPIFYLYPLAGRTATLGLDLLSEPVRRQAVERAIATREDVATPSLPLAGGQSSAVLILSPLFSNERVLGDTMMEPWGLFQGVVVGAIIPAALVEEAIRLLTPVGIDIVVLDQEATDGRRLLAFHSSRTRKQILSPTMDVRSLQDQRYQRTYALAVADRTWMIVFSATDDFISTRRSALPWVTLFGGLFAAFAATGIIGVMRRDAIRAREQQADAEAAKACLEHEIERREAVEESLGRAQKLEGVAQLAGGIAHDFNNLLAAALGSVTLVRADVASLEAAGAHVDEDLRATQDACLHARDLARRLLAFSKDEAPKRQLASLSELVEDAVRFALSGSAHKVRFSFDDPLWPAEVDVTQVTQVVDNLVLNAVQAMEGAGQIEVQTGNETVTADNDLALSPGPYVVIRVKDQGHGIPEEHVSRLYDPFFTTKKTGSGLGLPISFRIAARHGGILSLESTGPQGTTFALYLPALPGVEPQDKPAPRAELPTSGHALVIDDEPSVRRALCRMLERLGWSVDEAESGEEGCAILAQACREKRAHDLVITDLTMPGGIDGVEVARQVREISAVSMVVLSSGYELQSRLDEKALALFDGRLSKPYTYDELRATLIEMWGPR